MGSYINSQTNRQLDKHAQKKKKKGKKGGKKKKKKIITKTWRIGLLIK